jgi:hypothetical protein
VVEVQKPSDTLLTKIVYEVAYSISIVGQQPFSIRNLYGYGSAEYSRCTNVVVCDGCGTCQAEGYGSPMKKRSRALLIHYGSLQLFQHIQ